MTGSAARIRDARPAAGVSSWPHDADHSPELSIGRVVEELAEEFPAISLSKVRYLESEGLVNPARTGAGYRKYSAADVERLRYVLAEQRDSFTPLSVIRSQLDALDAGHSPHVVASLRSHPPRGIPCLWAGRARFRPAI